MPDAPPPPPPGATPVPPGEAPPPPPRRRPNYLVRRAVVVGGVVIVIAAVAVVVGWVVGRDDGGDDPVSVDTAWDVVAVVDPVTGAVAVTDPDSGEVMSEIETEVGRVTETALVGTTLIVVGASGQAGVDVGAGAAVDLDPNDTLSGSVGLVRPEGTDETIMLTDDGGDVIIVHGDPVQVIATSALIELAGVRIDAESALATPDGTSVLLPDVGNFQSVLATFGSEEPVYLPGAPLALDDESVATVLNVGAEARVTISSHDGETLSEVATDPIAGALLDDGELLAVSTDGAVQRIVDGESTQVRSLTGAPIPRRTWVMTTGDRLVVTTDSGTDVLDEAGGVVVSVAGASPLLAADDEPWSPSIHHALCLAATTDDGIVLLDARDGGRSTAAAEGDLLVRADGCAGIVSTDGDIAPLAVDPADIAVSVALEGEPGALSPDGVTVASELDRSIVVEQVVQPDDGDPIGPVTVAGRPSPVYFASS